MDITYTISLTVTRAAMGAEKSEDAVVAEWMETDAAKRELEREVLQALRKLDGDCDCEVMETELVEN